MIEDEDEDYVTDMDDDMDDDFDVDDDSDIEDDSDMDDKKPANKVVVNSKPKLIGKHSLVHDSIFKGKKTNNITDEAESEYIIKNVGGSLDISDGVLDGEESNSSIDYYRDSRLKTVIRDLLEEFTDINFLANRRKPSKSDFNAYYALLIKELFQYGYTKTEIFIELSGYFTDNIWNMFQLLENKYSNIIISELKEKVSFRDMDKIDFL